MYNSSGLLYYAHPDMLGSIRLATTPSRAMYFDTAYAPFGETYASTGTLDPAYTGQMNDTARRQDVAGGLYDFPAREYSTQGRWPSPDPAGLAAVDPTNPQSWNRYAYVYNNPTTLIDPLGLMCGASWFSDVVSAECSVNSDNPGFPWAGFGRWDLICSNYGVRTDFGISDRCSWQFGNNPDRGPRRLGPGAGQGPTPTLQKPKVNPPPKLKFKPPSWKNFLEDFVPCWGAQLTDNFLGSEDKAFWTVFLTVGTISTKNPALALGLLLWTANGAFKAGAACADASRAVYQ